MIFTSKITIQFIILSVLCIIQIASGMNSIPYHFENPLEEVFRSMATNLANGLNYRKNELKQKSNYELTQLENMLAKEIADLSESSSLNQLKQPEINSMNTLINEIAQERASRKFFLRKLYESNVGRIMGVITISSLIYILYKNGV